MPSFDIVSELNPHEVANAVDQANREVGTRFDFKGTDAKYELAEYVITLSAPADFQLKQMMDILKAEADQARHRYRVHESRRARHHRPDREADRDAASGHR
jgi:uncharacterized protein YajQ (UPF0234 family)